MSKFVRVAAAAPWRVLFRRGSADHQRESYISTGLRACQEHAAEFLLLRRPFMRTHAVCAYHTFIFQQEPLNLQCLLPFGLLQPRCCSNSTGDVDAEVEKLEALQKLSNLVEAWIEHGEVDIEGDVYAQAQTNLFRSPGLVDDWNLEDWHEAMLAVKEEVHEKAEEDLMGTKPPKQPGNALPQIDGKRVYGLDKCLPARVAVEFTEMTSLSNISESEVNKLMLLTKEDEAQFFPEGLPKSFAKEFDISKMSSMLIRRQLLKLIDHFRCLAGKNLIKQPSSPNKSFAESDPMPADCKVLSVEIEKTGDNDSERLDESNKEDALALTKSVMLLEDSIMDLSYNQRKKLTRERRFLDKANLGSKKHLVLDGLPGCGKTFVLGMLVQWARSEGWLVCYIPSGKKWTHGRLFYKNEVTGLWDTPVEAVSMLEDLMKSHGDLLETIPCRIFDPIPLGEGAGIGFLTGAQEIAVEENSSLKDLIQMGIDSSHAATGVCVRLRKELSLVQDVPVLIAVDEFNSWFTFSAFHERYDEFGRRPIHARNIAMVNAYRDMTYGPYMIGAFSHSTSVGKLPKQLPGIPREAKVFLNRYDFLEASIMLKHYMSQWRPKAKFGKRARRALYMLTNGNGHELRDMALLTAGFTVQHGMSEEEMGEAAGAF